MLTKEQLEFRCGYLSASAIHKIMGKKGIGATGESYLWEIIAQRETGVVQEPFENEAMRWGNQHEPEAIEVASVELGEMLVCGESSKFMGVIATPDFVGFDFGGEVKCPFNSANHAKRLRYNDQNDIKENLPEYYWQILTGMIVCNLHVWYYVDYDPRFVTNKIKIIKVEKDQADVKLLCERIALAMEFIVKQGGNVEQEWLEYWHEKAR